MSRAIMIKSRAKAKAALHRGVMVAPPAPRPNPVAPPEPPCLIPQSVVEFDVSPRCTRKCPFCAPGIPDDRREASTYLSLEIHNRIIDELVEARFDRGEKALVYCGHGEPLTSPNLREMLVYAREKLPKVHTVVYTNGDLLDEGWLEHFCRVDLSGLIWDVYDDGPTTRRVPEIIRNSPFPIERIRVIDHVADPPRYVSRGQAVKGVGGQPLDGTPCSRPLERMFITDNGDSDHPGALWLLCCDDYRRNLKWPGSLSPLMVNQDGNFLRMTSALAAGDRSVAKVCSKCDRYSRNVADDKWPPELAETRHWPPVSRFPIMPPKFRRLVVIAATGTDLDRTIAVLEAVEKLSVIDGRSVVVWNDKEPCPEKLAGPFRDIIEIDHALGWPGGMACAVGMGYELALEGNYDAIIKLDSDCAIVRRGWDASILQGIGKHEQRGFALYHGYMDWSQKKTGTVAGAFRDKFEDRFKAGGMMWARGLVRSSRWHDFHIQGGCYAMSRGALERIRDAVGLVPPEEDKEIGEDYQFTARCRVSGVQQTHCPAVMSAWSHHSGMHLSAAREFRDFWGVSVVHPIKAAADIAKLAGEAR